MKENSSTVPGIDDTVLLFAYSESSFSDIERAPDFFQGHPSGCDNNTDPLLHGNRQDGTEWVALPVTNFEAYFSTSFGRKYLPKLPKEVLERSDSGYGVGRYLVKPAYLPQI